MIVKLGTIHIQNGSEQVIVKGAEIVGVSGSVFPGKLDEFIRYGIQQLNMALNHDKSLMFYGCHFLDKPTLKVKLKTIWEIIWM